jgi:hypothetical protein
MKCYLNWLKYITLNEFVMLFRTNIRTVFDLLAVANQGYILI